MDTVRAKFAPNVYQAQSFGLTILLVDYVAENKIIVEINRLARYEKESVMCWLATS